MPQVYGKAQRVQPSATAESAQVQLRTDHYGGLITAPMGHGLMAVCEEGSYFNAINPTPGTGIAQSIQATFSATNGAFCLRNGDTAGGKRITMDYLRLINTVVGASTTRSEALVAIDSTIRYSSGGSAIIPTNANMDSGTATIAVCHFGALSLSAESGAVRRVSRFQLRTAIMVQYEEFIITFGRPTDFGAFNTLSGTAGQRMVVDAGPVIIGPNNHSLTIHIWHTGNAVTAPSWEFEAGWIER